VSENLDAQTGAEVRGPAYTWIKNGSREPIYETTKDTRVVLEESVGLGQLEMSRVVNEQSGVNRTFWIGYRFSRKFLAHKATATACPGYGFEAKPSAEGWIRERDSEGNDVFRSPRMVVRVAPGDLPEEKLPPPMMLLDHEMVL